MTVATELQKIEQIKRNINTSIKNKGVNILNNTPLEDYPNKIDAISGSASSKNITLIQPTKVLKIEDNVLKGFDYNKYARIDQSFTLSNYTWSLCFKFKHFSRRSRERLFSFNGADVGDTSGGFVIDLSSSHSHWWIATGHTPGDWTVFWDIACNTEGSFNYNLNTVYWLKAEFTGSYYAAYVSTNGTDWIQDVKIMDSRIVDLLSTRRPLIGTAESPSTQTFDGEVYLSDCWIKINNIEVWHG